MYRTEHRITIVNFEDAGSTRSWSPVNDRVMGGLSHGEITAVGKGTAVFAGDVSLENNGGFASVRCPIGEGSLRGMEGVELRVRGDGKVYRFNVSGREGIRGEVYRASFVTVEGQWIPVRLPFAAMERFVRGVHPPGSPRISAERITRIGLSIGDGQCGRFRLEIDRIRGYREAGR